jgi:5-methylcytosine-specific restriction endonuclease McrA
MKPCKKCNTLKPLEDFSVVKRNRDGRHNNCKICYAEYMKLWSRKNAKNVNARVLKYHHKNSVELNLKRQIRYEANKQQHLDTNKKWNAANKEKVTLYKTLSSLKRRAQKIDNGTFDISKKELKKLRSLPCFYCGVNGPSTIDHVIPLNKGGTHAIGNLVACCKSCNSAKKDKFIVEWRLRNKKVNI